MYLHKVYVSLGSNLGDRVKYLQQAVLAMDDIKETHVTALSRIYETDPVGYTDQPLFLNACAALITSLSPIQVLDALLNIEHKLGRVRTFRNGPRTIDLDLLLYDDYVIDLRPSLTVPHPRMHERAFVLLPLCDVSTDLEHPTFHKPIAKLRASVSEKEGIRCYRTHLLNAYEPTGN